MLVFALARYAWINGPSADTTHVSSSYYRPPEGLLAPKRAHKSAAERRAPNATRPPITPFGAILVGSPPRRNAVAVCFIPVGYLRLHGLPFSFVGVTSISVLRQACAAFQEKLCQPPASIRSALVRPVLQSTGKLHPGRFL